MKEKGEEIHLGKKVYSGEQDHSCDTLYSKEQAHSGEQAQTKVNPNFNDSKEPMNIFPITKQIQHRYKRKSKKIQKEVKELELKYH